MNSLIQRDYIIFSIGVRGGGGGSFRAITTICRLLFGVNQYKPQNAGNNIKFQDFPGGMLTDPPSETLEKLWTIY